MDRTKLIAVAVAALATIGGITLFVGNASAATWHDYKGDIFAGHAYGLQVPAGARAYEIALSGDGNMSAQVSVFDPAGVKLGYYALSGDLTSASIVSPAAGRHVIYVYDITDGALNLRVDAEQAPALALQKIALKREDVPIGESDTMAKLDKAMTATLKATPVFATLLYEGSAQKLDATVASTKGDVVTITRESGTAFSPGVWSAVSGQRSMNPANLEGASYTITVHAEKFEGSMFLTTLSLDLKAAPVPTPPAAPGAPPAAPAPPAPELVTGAFKLPIEKPIAFYAPKGKLILEHPAAKESRDGGYVYDVVAIYAPDDKLVKLVTLDSRHPNATLDLPEAGEYVAYVHTASAKNVLAKLAGTTAPVSVRELALRKENFTLSSEGADGSEKTFSLMHAPVEMRLSIDDDSFGALASASLKNAEGVVASIQSLAHAPGAQFLAWSDANPERFSAGEHTLSVDGLFDGKLQLLSISYVRHMTATPTTEADEEEHHEHLPLEGLAPVGLPVGPLSP